MTKAERIAELIDEHNTHFWEADFMGEPRRILQAKIRAIEEEA